MKYLIFSDLHGSLDKINYIISEFNEGKYDKMIFLGDLLYHGPRNNLPDSYNPKEVANIVKKYKDKIIFIKGNCDAEVDEMVIEASSPFNVQYSIKIKNKNIYFTHGHHLSRFEPSPDFKENDIIIYGHYHTFDISEINSAIYYNVGSITLPKDNKPGFAVLDENGIKSFDENKKLINEYLF